MAWILHVSDAHLGKSREWQYLDAMKRDVLEERERSTTQAVLRSTLHSLAQWPDVEKFDAVVFSGDITNGAAEDGYKAFESLLAELGSKHPGNERIVVVPGNHDVDWNTDPGSKDRYKLFQKYVRDKGFVTPLLDGSDFHAAGKLDPTAKPPFLEHEDFVLVALNSSNYCGTDEIETGPGVNWDRVLRLTLPKTRKAAESEIKKLKKLRRHDIARISGDQLSALTNFLESKNLLPKPEDGRPRIAVLHHHLLPVSTREEIKTFESVTNLNEVRSTLRDLGFRVVLHGHKHESAIFWDYVQDPATSINSPSHRLLVIAAPGMFRPNELTCRILEVLPNAPLPRGKSRETGYAPLVRIHDVAGRRRTEAADPILRDSARLWESEMTSEPSPLKYVYGSTIDSAYERLQSLLSELEGDDIHDLVCVIEAPGAARSLPAGYPPTQETDEDEWFQSLLRLWQMPKSRVLGASKLLPFNHGERLYDRYGDTVTRAANALIADPSTTRSFVLLVDPKDEAGNELAEYPAFVLAQLRIVIREASRRLDIVGYFRKQDVRSWWPLNVAELAKMQRDAMGVLDAAGVDVKQGRIVTFASTALIDDKLPALQVTRLDRALDQAPKDLWRMAYAATHPAAVQDPAEELARWEKMLADLDSKEGEAPRIATEGLQHLRQLLEDLAAVQPQAAAVVEPVRDLAAAHRVLSTDPTDEVRQEQRQQARAALASLKAVLKARLGCDGESV